MSPWVFYAIDVVQSLRMVMIITAFLSIFCLFVAMSCSDNYEPLPPLPLGKWEIFLIFLVTGVVAAILAIFLPSNETMVQMLVAVTGTDIDHIRQIEEVTNAILQR